MNLKEAGELCHLEGVLTSCSSLDVLIMSRRVLFLHLPDSKPYTVLTAQLPVILFTRTSCSLPGSNFVTIPGIFPASATCTLFLFLSPVSLSCWRNLGCSLWWACFTLHHPTCHGPEELLEWYLDFLSLELLFLPVCKYACSVLLVFCTVDFLFWGVVSAKHLYLFIFKLFILYWGITD